MMKNRMTIGAFLSCLVVIALCGSVAADDFQIEAIWDLNITSMTATPVGEPENGPFLPTTISLANGPADVSFNGVTANEAAPADNYTWWIDGFDPIPAQPDPEYIHTFTTPNLYDVTLFAENRSFGSVAEDSQTVENMVRATVPIEGNFTNTTNATPFKIDFCATFNNTRWRGVPTVWTWEFFNETAMVGTLVTHERCFTYAFPMNASNVTYLVNVTASNTTGFVVDNFTSKPVEVPTTILIGANFTATFETCPAFPVDVAFRDNSSARSFLAVDSQFWDFGDNTNTTQKNPTHQYHRPGTYLVNYTAINTTFGFQNSSLMNLPVSGLYANFTYDMNFPVNGITPGQGVRVNFTNTSEGSPTNFLWNFGDGLKPDLPVTENFANHTYLDDGTYNASLTVYRMCGDTLISNTSVKPITIYETLVANFTYHPNSGKYPLPVQFTDTSSDSPFQFEWWFYDLSGNLIHYSDEKDPTWVYDTPGTYKVVHHVTNTRELQAQKISRNIVLYDGITAGFTADKRVGTYPFNVNFQDTSMPEGQATNWNWTFGDSLEVSTLRHANHTYTTRGNFTVSLTASNSQTSDTATKPAFISVGTVLTPAFTPTGLVPVRAPFVVNFTDATTPADEVSAWNWSFSDGGSAKGRSVSHQFPGPGIYDVTLNASSYWDTRGTTAQVNITEVKEPIADFVMSPLTVNAGESVAFEDRSLGPGPLNWSWEFGDGGNATSQYPVYTYPYAGRYYPSLTVKNPYGSDTKHSTIPVSVRGPVIPSFTTDKPDWWAVINQPVTFIDTSKGQPVSWVWDFADGTAPVTVDTPVVNHTYIKSGVFNVTMMATNWIGDTRMAFHSFEVTDRDVPRDVNFGVAGKRYSGAAPLTVTFEDLTPAQSNVLEWYWDYGDRSNEFFTTPTSPTHTYTRPGEYAVTLTVRNAMGVNEKIRVAYVVVV